MKGRSISTGMGMSNRLCRSSYRSGKNKFKSKRRKRHFSLRSSLQHRLKSIPCHGHQAVSAAKTPPKNIHKPLADTGQEALAQHIYGTLNTPLDKRLSLVNARRIVLMQSEDRVRAALKCLQQRKTVTNPTGFLMTLLRSNHLT